jgi:putative ABC transport system substrate-binding protein
VIEYRWSEGRAERFVQIATEFVRLNVDVIVTSGTPQVLATKQATSVIPIVFARAGDPVANGLVASLSRPGGNVTGVTALNVEVAPKRLELLHEVVPPATSIALLVNLTNPTAQIELRNLQATAHILGRQFRVLHASTERDFDTVFATIAQMRAGGLVIVGDPFFISRIKQLAALATRHAVPTIFEFREFAVAGGLMSYGGSIADTYR